jgi:hypothetical protein
LPFFAADTVANCPPSRATGPTTTTPYDSPKDETSRTAAVRRMGWLTTLSGYLTPAFLILSPVLSYSDQAYSMYRARSSAGFSLDIPLIMLVASLLR